MDEELKRNFELMVLKYIWEKYPEIADLLKVEMLDQKDETVIAPGRERYMIYLNRISQVAARKQTGSRMDDEMFQMEIDRAVKSIIYGISKFMCEYAKKFDDVQLDGMDVYINPVVKEGTVHMHPNNAYALKHKQLDYWR